jgi:phage-related protein
VKPLIFIADTRRCLLEFPQPVRNHVGFALYQAQMGGKHVDARPLKGLGSGVLEVVSDHRGDTYRAVYTVRLANAVYVLHAFQKKSKHGVATPQSETELIRLRLRRAIEIDGEKEK